MSAVRQQAFIEAPRQVIWELIRDVEHDPERFRINCVDTGAYVDLTLTEAQGACFVDAAAGLEAKKLGLKVFDAVAGRRYFRHWLEESLEAMRTVAQRRGSPSVGDPGLEPGTSSLSERRSDRLS